MSVSLIKIINHMQWDDNNNNNIPYVYSRKYQIFAELE